LNLGSTVYSLFQLNILCSVLFIKEIELTRKMSVKILIK
jgi:hypothetical protein